MFSLGLSACTLCVPADSATAAFYHRCSSTDRNIPFALKRPWHVLNQCSLDQGINLFKQSVVLQYSRCFSYFICDIYYPDVISIVQILYSFHFKFLHPRIAMGQTVLLQILVKGNGMNGVLRLWRWKSYHHQAYYTVCSDGGSIWATDVQKGLLGRMLKTIYTWLVCLKILINIKILAHKKLYEANSCLEQCYQSTY